MTVQELIDWLERLPREAKGKPVQMNVSVDDDDLPVDVDTVDYDLRVVTLR